MKVPASAAPDVQESFRELHRAVDVFNGTKDIDLRGRRITNAGRSEQDADYVTKSELSSDASGDIVNVTTNGVRSLAGTANQVIADAPTGAVTLSLPQNIHAGSTPTFAGAAFTGRVNLKNYTVATLPVGTRGDVAYVTDALLPAFLGAVGGGGANVVPVFFDGTNWIVF